MTEEHEEESAAILGSSKGLFDKTELTGARCDLRLVDDLTFNGGKLRGNVWVIDRESTKSCKICYCFCSFVGRK